MDFREALAVLQQRTTHATGTGTGGGVATDPSLICAECDDTPDAKAATPLAAEMASFDLVALLRVFLERQEERVAAYRRFEEGFLLFLQVAEAEPASYEALVKHSTGIFATISAAINGIESELRGRGPAALQLADLLRSIQGLEREKLQLTAQLQIVRHGLALDALRAEGDEFDADGMEARMAALRADEGADLGRRLTSLTGQLNDALDEVRCELSELAEDEEED